MPPRRRNPYLFSPYRLIDRAVSGGFITPEQGQQGDTLDAAEEIALQWGETWPEGEGFGSSDFTFALEDFLRAIGVKTHFVDGRLTKKNPRRNPAKKPRPLSRAEKAVRRVEEALKAGVVLHWSAARGDGTAGPYHTAVGSPKFAVIAYGRHPYDYVGSLNEVAYHLVDHIGVANVIESLKATARLHGTAYTNLDTPISWGSPARHRR